MNGLLRMRLPLLLVLSGLLFVPSLLDCAIAAEQPARQIVVPDNVELMKDIEFGKGGDKVLKMDIARPKPMPKEPLPCLVQIHGGGWYTGSKDSETNAIIRNAQRGYVCVAISYRLSSEATFPAQIQDCKCAIRFLRAHADKYGLDPKRIGVRGGSAGGHLAALLGTSGGIYDLEGEGGWKESSSNVQAVCDLYGPTDFFGMTAAPYRNDSAQAKLVGGPLKDNIDRVKQANPANYCTPDDPPFIIFNGDLDDIVPLNQAETLYTKLKEANVVVDYYIVRGGGHGKAFNWDQINAMVDVFFDAQLKNKK